MDPNIYQLSRIIYNERLEEARLYRQAAQAGQTNQQNIRSHLGSYLMSLGQKLKAGRRPEAATPVSHVGA